jgi:hypothetical protein
VKTFKGSESNTVANIATDVAEVMQKVKTDDMTSDFFTKALSPPKFLKVRAIESRVLGSAAVDMRPLIMSA